MERWRRSPRAASIWRPMPWLGLRLLVVSGAGGVPLAWLGVVALGEIGRARAVLFSGSGRLLANTIGLGVAVAGLVGGVGTLLGFLLAKTDLPGRQTLMA